MATNRCREFLQDARASVAVEFVALLPAFLFLTFFIFEIFVAVLWVGTVEKAAQLGARLAIVSSKVVTGLPATYPKKAGFLYGQNCSIGACGTSTINGFASKVCTGGTGLDCDPATCVGAALNVNCFTVIYNRMHAIAPVIQPQHVTIRYDYVGLGFAGGPIIPTVTVTVQGVPYGLFMTSILAGFMRLVTGNPAAGSPLTNLPTISATFTGEDLNTAGAS